MTRWIIATLLVLSALGSLLWPGASFAQEGSSVGPVQTFEVEDGHALGLSPDGARYAVVVRREALCVYATDTQAELSCSDLETLRIDLRIEDAVWSPDSTRIAFSENGFRYGRDADLWVMDAVSGELTNVTDDGFAGSLLGLGDDEEEPTHFMDVVPAWTPDSRFITFSRSPVINGEYQGNVLAQVPASGGEVEELVRIPDSEPGSIYWRMGWAPSGETLYFSLTHLDSDHPDNGIWTYDRATGEIAPLAFGDDPELGPLALLRVSPTGDHLLAWYPMVAPRRDITQSTLRLVNTATGELSPIEMPAPTTLMFANTTSATFSPDGLSMLVVFPGEDRLYQVWALDLTGGEPQMLVDSLEDAWIDVGVMPSWGANGIVFVGNRDGEGYLFTVDGIGLSSNPSPVPESNSTPVTSPNPGFATGETVVVIGIAPMFAAPDPTAMVVLVLTPGAQAQILSGLVESDAGHWYPALDPETQTIGYVQADRLGPSA